MEFSLHSSSFVGLDISASHLHLVQLRRKKQAYHLCASLSRALPEGIFVEGKIKDWSQLTQTLQEEVAYLGLQGLPCGISLPANLVRMQAIQLPHGLSDREIEEEIRALVQQDLSGKAEALAIDFFPLKSQERAYQHLFFVAARKNYLTQFEQAVNQAGLKTKVIEVDVFALMRLVDKALGLSQQDSAVQIIVHVVQWTILFVVCRSGEMIFHQRFQLMEKADVFHELKNKIEVCASLFHATEKIQCILCKDNAALKADLASAFPHWQIACLDLSACLISREANLQADYNMLATALGVAMREVPVW